MGKFSEGISFFIFSCYFGLCVRVRLSFVFFFLGGVWCFYSIGDVFRVSSFGFFEL